MDQQRDEANRITSVNEADRRTHLANERPYLAWVAHWIATLGVAKSFQRLPRDLGRPTRCSVQARRGGLPLHLLSPDPAKGSRDCSRSREFANPDRTVVFCNQLGGDHP